MIASKSDELKELKKGKRFVEDGLNSSKDEMKEKRATLASLNERVWGGVLVTSRACITVKPVCTNHPSLAIMLADCMIDL